jgi:DNA sulfur modification protein DndC
MIGLPLMPTRFAPSKETLAVLNGRQWICSFSGGKDSTTLVTWIEYLRRVGLVKCPIPRLVMSDTTVEFPFLRGIADRVMTALTACGWHCEVVTPRIHERLYNRIFGIGNTPVHPGGRKRMRWCTRATKIDPMSRFSKGIADDMVQLSGVRWGESDVRDGKLAAKGCAAGGECGLPEPGEGVYGPIITWKVCKVVEWLSGEAGEEVSGAIADLLPLTKELVGVYEVKKGPDDLFGVPPKVTALRFGCIGCPAITNERVTKSRQGRERPEWAHLRRLYDIWDAFYANRNRCCRVRGSNYKSGRPWPKTWAPGVGYGPLKMEARKKYFAVLLDIQEKSGVTLVTPEDIAFIRDCWERKAYPRGWSEADELVQPPDETMFKEPA